MRPRRLPPVLEAPTRRPLSERIANLCLVDVLAQLAASVDVPALSSDQVQPFPIVDVFGKRYALSGNLEHGYCYAIGYRNHVSSTPALSIDQGWIWQYPPGLKPKPIGTFLRDLHFVES